MSDITQNPKTCGWCERPGCSLKCACRIVFYCGKDCQKAHYPEHKKKCPYCLSKQVKAAKIEHGKDDLAVGIARQNEAEAYDRQGQYKQAERSFLEARRIFEEVQGEESGKVGEVSRSLAQLYEQMGKYNEAMTVLKKQLEITRNNQGERTQDVGVILRLMGTTYFGQGKTNKALATLEEAHSILKEVVGSKDSLVGTVLSTRGCIYHKLGRYDQALADFTECMEIKSNAHGDDSSDVATSFQQLGETYAEMGRHDEALINHKKALEIFRRNHGENHEMVACQFHNIGKLLVGTDVQESMKIYNKAIKINIRLLGENHVGVGKIYVGVGNVYGRADQHDKAFEMFEKAHLVYTRALGADHIKNAETLCSMASAKLNCGDFPGAIGYVSECLRIYDKFGINDGPEYENASGLLQGLQRLTSSGGVRINTPAGLMWGIQR
jgi:tetratricopeptide (TPR) repeat protein